METRRGPIAVSPFWAVLRQNGGSRQRSCPSVWGLPPRRFRDRSNPNWRLALSGPSRLLFPKEGGSLLVRHPPCFFSGDQTGTLRPSPPQIGCLWSHSPCQAETPPLPLRESPPIHKFPPRAGPPQPPLEVPPGPQSIEPAALQLGKPRMRTLFREVLQNPA